MRLGVADASGHEAAHIAKIAQECGIDAVTVHGRTRVQGYSGNADYEAIGRGKSAVHIPVIGNGDILTSEDAKRMKAIANVDVIMIGRGSLGNPWIFRNIENASNDNGAVTEPSLDDKKKALLKHFELELFHRDQKTAVLHMRRIACWYFKNIPDVNEFRGKINVCKTAPEMRALIEDFGVNN